VIRILVDNHLRLRLDQLIDSQLVRHKIGINRPVVGDDVIDTLEEIVDEIADHGVFGAAYHAVLDRLKERGADPDLSEGSVLRTVGDLVPDLSTDLLAFFHDRLKVHLRAEDITHDVIDAALSKPPVDDLALVVARARALQAFLADPGRRKPRPGLPPRGEHPDPGRGEGRCRIPFRRGPEIRGNGRRTRLFKALDTATANIAPALEAEDFAAAMSHMAALRAPIDAFFEAVPGQCRQPGRPPQPLESASSNRGNLRAGRGSDQALRLTATRGASVTFHPRRHVPVRKTGQIACRLYAPCCNRKNAVNPDGSMLTTPDFTEITPTAEIRTSKHGNRAKCLQRLIRLDLPVPMTVSLSFDTVRAIAQDQLPDMAALTGLFGDGALVSVRSSSQAADWGGPGTILNIGMNDAVHARLDGKLRHVGGRRVLRAFHPRLRHQRHAAGRRRV
jgi:hypothetical protein